VKTGGFTFLQRSKQRLINGCGSLLVSPGRKWRRTDVLDWSDRDLRRGKHPLKSVKSLSGLLMAVLRPECDGCERVRRPPGSA
jgi:hypothetical protein